MNKLLVRLFGSIILLLWGKTPILASPEVKITQSELEQAEVTLTPITPLAELLLSQPTANHLSKGEVIINLDTRSFFFPDLVRGAVDDSDSAVNFNTGFTWGISDELQLSLQFQHVDSSSPIKQGEFTSERTEDNEAALELKQRIWQNQSGDRSLSGVVSASWGTRGFMFTQAGTMTEINNRNVFVSVAAPFTAAVGDRWQFSFTPTVAFFKDENAGFFQRLPNDRESNFSTVLGLGGGIAYRLNDRLSLVTDVFLPLTGNNSISRDSGKPDQAIAYNAGIRYLKNPQLAVDLYATNTFASFAPLSLTADRSFVGLGANIRFMPDALPANRKYALASSANQPESLTTDGVAFFDGGTLPSGKLALNLQGGSQGILTAVRYGLLRDLEGMIFLDYVSGEVDESEQGIGAKLRLLNQQENAPITLSAAATVGLTNEPFINFVNNDADTFDNRDLEKSVPIFTPGGDDGRNGKLLIITASLPIQYEINSQTAVWFTPILGYAQRQGLEIGGFNLGGAIAVTKEVSLTAEVGANFLGEGNSFSEAKLADKIPWTTGVRWQPSFLLGKQATQDNSDPYLELYLTNRVGSSPWHQLRVREDNSLAVGVGLFLPFNK
ncbi:hypothetical protein C7B62_18920 [Pleurocapsa sp. CCALA 161]|uniref:hypothetical protein n=1 Tax=Pleurocapsa sp. CCALA 161 TaxID=2107688 RepID=UPI000D07B6BD|nr:hypothetical protein [Pleurocapsa sp. CCALA 161]PSB07736.1 hypothetical protein C7B62_18920 [Pleurocapsa sp. CCALA 161]